MRVTLKAIHDELQRLGHDVRLEKGDGYFYFLGAEVNNWLDRTVKVPTLGSLTREQWVEEFNRLKKLNEDLLSGQTKPSAARQPAVPSRARKKSL
jgi:hypothetical protein